MKNGVILVLTYRGVTLVSVDALLDLVKPHRIGSANVNELTVLLGHTRIPIILRICNIEARNINFEVCWCASGP